MDKEIRNPTLPSTASLRAFEASARLLSFTDAANELSQTQGAVSHQIRELEARLDQQLFDRLPRGITLTDAGKRYLPYACDVLDRLYEADKILRNESQDNVLTVSCSPNFAQKWLAPRIGSEPVVQTLRFVTATVIGRNLLLRDCVRNGCFPFAVRTWNLSGQLVNRLQILRPIHSYMTNNVKDGHIGLIKLVLIPVSLISITGRYSAKPVWRSIVQLRHRALLWHVVRWCRSIWMLEDYFDQCRRKLPLILPIG